MGREEWLGHHLTDLYEARLDLGPKSMARTESMQNIGILRDVHSGVGVEKGG